MGLIHKPILRAVKATGFMGLALGFLGCAAQDVSPNIESEAETGQTVKLSANESGATNSASEGFASILENFTTDGKPIKIIETPWGPREVYDPLQDEEIRSILRDWYSENKRTYADYRDENSLQFQIIEQAAREQELGYLKNKCEMRERGFTFAESHYYKKKYIGDCDQEAKGDGVLSCVEVNLVDREIGRPEWMVTKRIKYHPHWGVDESLKKEIGMLKNNFIFGPQSYDSIDEQIGVFFKMQCRKWVGISDISAGYELYQLNAPPQLDKSSRFYEAFGLKEPSLKEFCETEKSEVKLCQGI